MKLIATLIAAALLSGCATTQPAPAPLCTATESSLRIFSVTEDSVVELESFGGGIRIKNKRKSQ